MVRRFVLVLVSVLIPGIALAEDGRPLSDKVYSGTIQNGDGSSFVVTMSLDSAGNGLLVSNPVPPDVSWLCQGTLTPINRNSEERRMYNYVLSAGSSEGCVAIGEVIVEVSEGVGQLAYQFSWQDPEKPSYGYQILGQLVDVDREARDVGSLLAEFEGLFGGDRYVLVQNFDITTDDFSAMMVWKDWPIEKIENSKRWPEFSDEFAERREKKEFREKLLENVAELDRASDEIAFKFTGAPVGVGEYDFDRNRLAFCVMVQAVLNTDDEPAPAVEFDWDSNGGCEYQEFAFPKARASSRGAQVWIKFDTLEEGEEFTKRVRSMRLTSDISCGGAVPLPDGNFRYGNFSFFCAPSTLVIYGTGGEVVYQRAFDEGQWWEDFQVSGESSTKSVAGDTEVAGEVETDTTVYIGRAEGQVKLTSRYWTEVDWPNGECVYWTPDFVVWEPSGVQGRLLLKSKSAEGLYTLKTIKVGESWDGFLCK